MHPRITLCYLACGILSGPGMLAAAPLPAPVQLEALTWPELQTRIRTGTTTVLLPIGGTEQSGPHLTLGKHNVRARLLAARIAERLGDTVVAPVLSYVPEGQVSPPSQHMRFPGTISIPVATFEALLGASARSLCQHGLREVFFLGDHGGYQQSLVRVAQRLNQAWGQHTDCRAHALHSYYQASQTSFVADLRQRGYRQQAIGQHAGLADTALSLALAPETVRTQLFDDAASGAPQNGVAGDPRQASAALGQLGVARILSASVEAIRASRRPARTPDQPALPSRK